ncbi:hypothetical protein K438DRAFT_1975580 [Mycena galopus ATCC 62051]|nr:hypothetical protein K438DRAFT_1975580 [Mycena galopus ATCC 62051]
MQAHVVWMQLDAESLEGEGQLTSVVSTVPPRRPMRASLVLLTNDLVHTPPARDDHLRRRRLPFSRLTGAVFQRWRHSSARALRPHASLLRLPGLPSNRAAPCAALDARNYLQVRRAAPPTAFVAPRPSPPHWSVTYAIRRNYQRRLSQGTVYSITTLRAIATRLRTCYTLRAMYCVTATSPHARYSVPDAVPRRHARYQASAHPSPDLHSQPHGQRVMLAFFIPHAAFVASPRCATILTMYRPHRSTPAPAALFGMTRNTAAFTAFSYTTTIYCPLRSTRAAWHIPNTTPMSPAPGPSSAASQSSSRNLPLARTTHTTRMLCTWPYPSATTVFSGAPPSAQSQVMLRSAARTTTSVRSIHCRSSPSLTPLSSRPHARPPSTAYTVLIARLNACTYLGTVPSTTCPTVRATPIASDHCADPFRRPTVRHPPPVCITKTTAMTAPARGAACAVCADGVVDLHRDAPAKSTRAREDDVRPPLAQQLRCAQKPRSRRAPPTSTRWLWLPFGNADPPEARAGERGDGLLDVGLLVESSMYFM